MEVDRFCPFPTPRVTYHGVAANAGGRPLVNIVEFLASERYYLAVVELPQIQCSDHSDIEWSVNSKNEVAIEGQINLATMFAYMPIRVIAIKKVQLCPNETWGISFYFPGPVDRWTTSVVFTSSTLMEISAMKRPAAEAAAAAAASTEDVAALGDVGSPALSVSPLSVAPPADVSSPTGSGSTEAGTSQEGDSSPSLSGLDDP